MPASVPMLQVHSPRKRIALSEMSACYVNAKVSSESQASIRMTNSGSGERLLCNDEIDITETSRLFKCHNETLSDIHMYPLPARHIILLHSFLRAAEKSITYFMLMTESILLPQKAEMSWRQDDSVSDLLRKVDAPGSPRVMSTVLPRHHFENTCHYFLRFPPFE